MTVAKIKEYVDACIEHLRNIDYFETIRMFIVTLEKINSMLDELEPEAKWTNNMNGTFTCSKCGAKRPNDNYCGNCGARMEVEE